MTRARAVAAVHVVVLLAGLALGLTAALRVVAGSGQWPRVALEFGAAVVLHDLVAFPAYAAADRVLTRLTVDGPAARSRTVPLVNHLRLPALGSLLLLVVFAPQVSGQGDSGFRQASGLSAGGAGTRWLAVSAALFALSAIAYGVRVAAARR